MKSPNNKTAALKKLKKQFINASGAIDKIYWKRALLHAEYYNLKDIDDAASEEEKEALRGKHDLLCNKLNRTEEEIKPYYKIWLKVKERLGKIFEKNP